MTDDYSYFFKLSPRQQLNDLMHKYAQANNGNYSDAWRELDKRWKERTGTALSWLKHRYNQVHQVNLTTPAFLEKTNRTNAALAIAHNMTENIFITPSDNKI
jgi:hypothetical protein